MCRNREFKEKLFGEVCLELLLNDPERTGRRGRNAGVGRSGTFICLDRILQQILVSDYVDIFGIVYAMRKERVWMVQTEQQYICIHQCLLAVLEGKELSGSPREIHENQGFEEMVTQLFSRCKKLLFCGSGKGVGGSGAVGTSLGTGEKER
ncbi:hypothetical protein Zmor_015345 [Zophobas morio]|uniref:Tyrosine-protein phosphatase domain-containing protein n=1 Tax=Zophobas morio TaxID=2755281 RepID=A0AA38MH43_9CUCU|nr:hypothetical protein Zmor_015345 [Zophobas morio]